MVTYFLGTNTKVKITSRQVYASYKDKHNTEGPIHILLVEDETVVKKYVRWVEKSDTMVGFCGKKEEHKCQSHGEIW
jgi:hypothetical protein